VRNLLERLAHPIESEPDRAQHETANTELHHTIVRLSGNRRVAEMYDSLHAHLTIARLHRVGASWQSRLDLEHSEHEQIVDALCRRDPRALQTALRKHIARAKRELVNELLEIQDR
jgi:DNA-binding GntR family transcriptional regulator